MRLRIFPRKNADWRPAFDLDFISVLTGCVRIAFWLGNSSAHPGEAAGRLMILPLVAVSILLVGSADSQTKPSAGTFSALAQQATEARDADRLEEAVRLYQGALAMRPQWEEGWWWLGTIEYDRDHYAKAALHFQKVIAIRPANGTAHAMLGLCQFELGQDRLALENLLSADRLGTLSDQQLRKVALYHLGVLELRTRRFGDAQETLLQLAKERVRTKELFTALGQAALLMDPREPLPEASALANVVDEAGQAEALSATKEFDPAKQIYLRLTSQYPAYPNLHFAYGRMLLEAHETDEAIEEFQRELNRDPVHVNSLLEIASVRYQVDSEDGLKYAEEAVKLAPEKPFAHYLLGLLRLDTGDAAGAVPELEIAQKALPKEAKIYFSLGTAYTRTGRKADAAKARAQFLRLDEQTREQSRSDVYGDTPSGVADGQLRIDNRGNSPQ